MPIMSLKGIITDEIYLNGYTIIRNNLILYPKGDIFLML